MIVSITPEYPFQYLCADYFELNGHNYLSVVDRFSGWIMVYHFPLTKVTSEKLIDTLRDIFSTYGIPKEISSDGGPQFVSQKFKTFLHDWGIHHRLSSAYYPQSNGRAELGVKTSKRIIHDNTNNGQLNTDKAAQAIMQYRNTPLQGINLSPAQILFHRQLRDHIPTNPSHYRLHKDWIISASQRETIVTKQLNVKSKYDQVSNNQLNPLQVGDHVLIQSLTQFGKKRWNKSGKIIEVLPF